MGCATMEKSDRRECKSSKTYNNYINKNNNYDNCVCVRACACMRALGLGGIPVYSCHRVFSDIP